MAENTKSVLNEVLILTVMNVTVCVDISCVRQVLQLTRLAFAPKTPEYFAGLMNFHGESIPVIDLAMRLALVRKNPYTLNTPMLICANDINIMGVIVDNIIGIEKINNNDVKYHDEFKDNDSPFLGSLLLGSEVALILNTDKLINENCRIQFITEMSYE